MINLSDQIHSTLLVADASESASLVWNEINQVIWNILDELKQPNIDNIYLLGTHGIVPLNSYHEQSNTVRPHGVSLIAPIIAELQQNHKRILNGLIIGSGKVFDLADYLDSKWVQNWMAIRVGTESLLPIEGCIPEYEASDLTSAITRLQTLTSKPIPVSKLITSTWSSSVQYWSIDRSGFPLVFVEPLQIWAHLFPVFKPQFEAYLSNQNNLGDSWYQALLELNPRLSYNNRDYSNYEKLILTGIFPEEIQAFSQWLGPEYSLPTVEEWRNIHKWFNHQPPELPPHELVKEGLSYSAERIWEGLIGEISPTSMLDLSLMNQGVIEWLRSPEWTGLGRTRPSFRPKLTDPLTDEPTKPIRHDVRLRYFGFRLIRREH